MGWLRSGDLENDMNVSVMSRTMLCCRGEVERHRWCGESLSICMQAQRVIDSNQNSSYAHGIYGTGDESSQKTN